MAALTADRDTKEHKGQVLEMDVAASAKIYAGALIARDSGGNAVPGSWLASLLGIGRAEEAVDNSGGGAGDLQVMIQKGIFKFKNRGNTVQVVTVLGTPTGGTFKLTYAGQQTATIAYNATAAAVQAALEALSNISQAAVSASGSSGGPYTITFQGDLAELEIELMTADGSALTGGDNMDVTVAFTTPSGKLTNGDIGNNAYIVDDEAVAKLLGAVSEVQVVTITGSPDGGTFTLTFSAQTTSGIAYNASAATVLAALEALSNIAVGDISVSGSNGGPYTITFLSTGAYPYTNVAQLTGDGGSLTGGTSPDVAIATTADGVPARPVAGPIIEVESDGVWIDLR